MQQIQYISEMNQTVYLCMTSDIEHVDNNLKPQLNITYWT